ncbi:MAG: cysteine synthase family protein [Ruminococcus sp.]|jgi:cysteine synthase A|nr:cysteine synthase family protein [Ruminococcus sp.]
MMYSSVKDLIGNTPIVRLSNSDFSEKINIYAKLEFYNPSGSVKDRVGAYMLTDAELRGTLKQGGTIVEATAGNTGLGIAFAALNKGYRVIFTVPTKFSAEKQILMRALGAEIVNTPAEDGMLGAERKAEELRKSIPGAISLGQFHNPANPLAHYFTTAREIYDDLCGKIDYFICGAGSGGTFSGIMKYLKEKNFAIQGILADPVGSTIGGGEHSTYDIEGIGNDFIADTMDISLVDKVFKISDSEAVSGVREIAKNEGLFVGSSSGAVFSAAKKLASELTSEKTLSDDLMSKSNNFTSADLVPESNNSTPINIVLIFADRGDRYFSKNLFN